MNDTPQSRVRWFHFTPGRFVLALLAVEVLLWLSDRSGWLGWHKGYAVLACVASVGVAIIGMAGWFLLAAAFRWRFQFRIRSLLMLAVVVAIPSGWLTVEMKTAREQKDVVDAVRKLGAWVEYDYGEDKAGGRNSKAKEPSWLRSLLGDDFFHGIQFVLWRELEVSDVALARLKEIHGLKHLYFLGSSISDSGWQQIQQFKGLTKLVLNDVRFADLDLARLQGMTELESLGIRGTQVTDSGLARLRGFTRLTELDLGETQITDAGLAYLDGLKQLQELRLNGTRITDRGMEYLQKLDDLDDLDLGATPITNSGLKYLKGLTKLQRLNLRDTRVTDAGVKEFQAALPSVVIDLRGPLVDS